MKGFFKNQAKTKVRGWIEALKHKLRARAAFTRPSPDNCFTLLNFKWNGGWEWWRPSSLLSLSLSRSKIHYPFLRTLFFTFSFPFPTGNRNENYVVGPTALGRKDICRRPSEPNRSMRSSFDNSIFPRGEQSGSACQQCCRRHSYIALFRSEDSLNEELK